MTPIAIDWLLLSGGAASRLGQEKASTEVVGLSLRERVESAICAADPAARIIDVGPERNGGPAAAVVASLAECSASFVGVVAIDMPFAGSVMKAVVRAIAEYEGEIDAWVPRDADGRDQWLCAVYRKSSLETRSTESDWHGRRFGDLLEGMSVRSVPVGEGTSLIDIDTPEDLQRAIAIAGGGEAEDGNG